MENVYPSDHPLSGHKSPAHRADVIISPVPAYKLVSLPQSIGSAFMPAHHIPERRDDEVMGHWRSPPPGYTAVTLVLRAPGFVIDRLAEIILPDSHMLRTIPAGRPASFSPPFGADREERARAFKPFGNGRSSAACSARSEYGHAEKGRKVSGGCSTSAKFYI